MKEKEPTFQIGENVSDNKKGYYGIDPEMSLQSVNFATSENQYLNEHFQEESSDK